MNRFEDICTAQKYFFALVFVREEHLINKFIMTEEYGT